MLLHSPATPAPLESAVKAAYLYKMAAFVTWPPAALGASNAPFRICVANGDTAGTLSRLVRGQQAWGRPIAVSRVSAGQSGAALKQCHMLYVAGGGAGDLDGVANAPVLTVTDRGSGMRGAVIEFANDGGHVRFIVHNGEAESRRLQISAKLLNVAMAVVR